MSLSLSVNLSLARTMAIVLLRDFTFVRTCRNGRTVFTRIPVIDLSDPNSKTLLVQACQEYGFFKLVNHGVPIDLITQLEAETANFFNSPQSDKNKAGPLDPFGYGNKKIGLNGDLGWLEYLLFNTSPELISQKSLTISSTNPQLFRDLANGYVSAVRNMACEVLEMMADGLNIEPRNVLSRMLRDEKSDSYFRLNYYPPLTLDEVKALEGRKLVGFGEHTDPQIISVLRSNNSSGLQIRLENGDWVSVPPDPNAFYINVDDSLQVMTNGKFKSVKHRVLADDLLSPRMSMVYFGGPAPTEKIAPLASMMKEGEESLYKEFTWAEYKFSAFQTKLADDRLKMFEKSPRD